MFCPLSCGNISLNRNVKTKTVISKHKIAKGNINNFLEGLALINFSSPKAESAAKEKTSRNIILDGCIVDNKGRSSVYGNWEIGFLRARSRDIVPRRMKYFDSLCTFFKENSAKQSGIMPINDENSK